MKITNRYQLPESLVNVVGKTYRPEKNRISVTSLISSPLVRKLTLDHWEELEEDVSNRLWMLLGTACHYILEQGSPDDAFGEEKLTYTTGNITIAGRSDLYHDGEISDWKVTSVFSFLLGEKPEWVAQLNVYKFLWEHIGFPVKKLTINAILRDWTKSKGLYDPDYPAIPFLSVNIPMWDNSILIEYIFDRIALHSMPAIECTKEEKWSKPDTFAVFKEGGKRALRVLESEELAKRWITDSPEDKRKDLLITKRKGEDTRCLNYCLVNKFCPYYKII